jgi:hypothetical protein
MFVSVEGNYREWLAVVGQFSGTTSSRPARFFGDPAAGTSAFMAGTRLSLGAVHGLAPFGQILVGVARSGDDRRGYPALGIQPGAGLDLAVLEHVKLRLAADYRRLLGLNAAAAPKASQTVLGAGLVVH